MPDHKPGDRVVCVAPRGYALTEGKEYVIAEVEPALHCPYARFTFPSYAIVLGDNGKLLWCHHHRFKPVA